ncbi:VC0807 family protein [Nonomuraea longispora]|uniref:VC0807 family protein n=1 Tax=Nonomuraea longispora TaxID=1848320 RepID=UPI001C705150|nr:VC0807 family protein [Nonomuraea longispora]
MTSLSGAAATRRAMYSVLGFEVAGPLAIFYGLRAAGVNQWLALLAGGVLPAGRAVHSIVKERRVSGVTLFVLGTMSLTIAMSFVTGSARVLLVRNAWGSAAMALWLLLSLLRPKPLLYEARMFMDREKQALWKASWEDFSGFRRALRVFTAIWGVAFAVDTAIRVLMALTLPIDLVPVLDDVLLVVTLLALIALQRFWGPRYLRKHGLAIRGGVEVHRLDEEERS